MVFKNIFIQRFFDLVRDWGTNRPFDPEQIGLALDLGWPAIAEIEVPELSTRLARGARA